MRCELEIIRSECTGCERATGNSVIGGHSAERPPRIHRVHVQSSRNTRRALTMAIAAASNITHQLTRTKTTATAAHRRHCGHNVCTVGGPNGAARAARVHLYRARTALCHTRGHFQLPNAIQTSLYCACVHCAATNAPMKKEDEGLLSLFFLWIL